jgi:hypothetical protein
MRTGHIEAECQINDCESLVRLRTQTGDSVDHYVAIAVHVPGNTVSFYAVEQATGAEVADVFMMRALFNCQKATLLIDKRKAAVLDGRTIKLAGKS